MMNTVSFTFILILSCFIISAAIEIDSISQSQNLTDGITMVSKSGLFELGFFSPGVSKNRYLGIWYKNISVPTYVWVANRVNPINDSSGTLMINNLANSLILTQNNTIVWSANYSSKQVQNLTLKLLDSGNLVLKEEGNSGDNNDSYSWQSFDYPTDTLLPDMKIGWNFRTNLNKRLSAWTSPNDPSPASLTMEMENNSYPEPAMWNGSKEYMRSGPWNGITYSAKPSTALPIIVYNYVHTKDELSFSYTLIDQSMIGRMILNQSMNRREMYLLSSGTEKTWRLYATMPRDYCDTYGMCGPFGRCDPGNFPACQCLKGFSPRLPAKWKLAEYTEGCVRNKPLNCGEKFGFVKYQRLKLPETKNTWVNESMSLQECKQKCLSNCSCTGYANTDIRGKGSGCVIWSGDLIDIKQITGGGQDLYVRLSASELDTKSNSAIIIGATVAAAAVMISGLLLGGFFIIRKKKKMKGTGKNGEKHDLELPLFDLSSIATATDNFSFNNKLGEGGFGSVFWGILADGQEIAVKRLSISSRQGVDEFKNEVILIAKLQHRNLVRLLGCCIEEEEKMLVYEYMPNKSLDSILFEEARRKVLDWSKRFNIICGIARGLLYLHQDSRLRIIHRDLKASNVLLDVDMNPKISDFGMARTFGGDQTEGNTRRVVGTYGYMAPEYAIDGQFSVKSDVFSFGILMLEIISGEKNRGFYRPNNGLNLVGHAWTLWNEGRPLELIDVAIGDSYAISEVLRCIQISLLCMQQHPEDRPTMSHVVLMLSSESALPQPKEPGFYMAAKESPELYYISGKNDTSSTNEMTITQLEAR